MTEVERFVIKQLSSLEKVRNTEIVNKKEILTKTALAGERFSYQLCVLANEKIGSNIAAEISVESALREHIRLYAVKEVFLDKPYIDIDIKGEDYLTHEPCFMPDVLIPITEQNHICSMDNISTFWVKVDIPRDIKPGKYEITVHFALKDYGWNVEDFHISKTMEIEVLPAVIEEQKLIYTRWFYADCIAVQHGVDIYSEAHWQLIDKYIAAAVDVGINMILVPIHTPPLDTAVDTRRPCVQLVDIEKSGDKYIFSFEKFKRFIDICKKNGVRYFEMAHMFSQWGAKFAANIMVTENGKSDYMFGWHVAADSEEYIAFLKQYIAAISEELVREGIAENTYFHISDEPTLESMETYKTASDIIRPLIGNSKTLDALSDYSFYEKGLVECPVTAIFHLQEFLEHDIPNQWTYYCGWPQEIYTNSFIGQPSYITRILGFLLYKYDIKGFLHWGFNFYNSRLSFYPINPYVTTSADGAFPSGDPFIVYPARNSVYPSIRGEVTYEAIQDMDICFTLEKYIGKEEVVKMMDEEAGFELKFDQYPKSIDFIEDLRARMIKKIKECRAVK